MGKAGRWAVRCGAAAHGAAKWTVYCLTIALVGGTVVYALFAAWLGLPAKQLLARVPVSVSPEAIGVGALVVLVLVVTDTDDSGIVRNELGNRTEMTNTSTGTRMSDGGTVTAAGEPDEETARECDSKRGSTGASEESVTEPGDEQDRDRGLDDGTGDGNERGATPVERASDAEADKRDADEEAAETAGDSDVVAGDTDEGDATSDETESTGDDSDAVETEAASAAESEADELDADPAPETGERRAIDTAATGHESSSGAFETHTEEGGRPGRDTGLGTRGRDPGTRPYRTTGRLVALGLAVVVGVVACYLLYRVLWRR